MVEERAKCQKVWGRKCRGSGSVGVLRNRIGEEAGAEQRPKEDLEEGQRPLQALLKSARTSDEQNIIHHHTLFTISQTAATPIPDTPPSQASS